MRWIIFVVTLIVLPVRAGSPAFEGGFSQMA